MEVEYISCSASVQEAVCLRRFLQHLEIVKTVSEPVIIFCDSMAALACSKDPKYHGKIKYIQIRYHYVRDMVAQKEVILKHISTSNMVADPLTKPIARDTFVGHVKSLGLCRM